MYLLVASQLSLIRMIQYTKAGAFFHSCMNSIHAASDDAGGACLLQAMQQLCA
jgi:hypothetical protein